MKFQISAVSLSLIASALLFPTKSPAVPSYARQTGLPCSGCHYNPPELNAAGRSFKLLGFVDKKKEGNITAEQDKKHAGLDLLGTLPLSAWLETSFTSTKAPQPGTQNGNFEFPQDISLFLAGAWSTHVGSFLQLTYDTQGDHFSYAPERLSMERSATAFSAADRIGQLNVKINDITDARKMLEQLGWTI